MIRFVGITEASKILGVSPQTIRRWEKKGLIQPEDRMREGQHRRYDITKLRPSRHKSTEALSKKTFAYARVSSHDQKTDLDRQRELLELYCSSKGWGYEIISDLGSGMNYHKKGLKRLLYSIVYDKVERLVVTHKDRLLRFGSELVFSLCETKGVEVVIINQGKEPSFEEELTQDVLEIITVFSARLYGSRSKKNKKLMQDLKDISG